jgi:hypothetical protein
MTLLLLRKRSPAYRLLDRFIVDRAAPLSSPRTGEPGPGTWTITDTESKLSVSGGKLQVAGKTTPANGDPGFWGPALSRVCGRAILGTIVRTTGLGLSLGWDSNTNADMQEGSFQLRGGNTVRADVYTAALVWQGVDTGYTTPSSGVELETAVILRATGVWLLLKDGGIWRVLWVHHERTTATVYPGCSIYSATGTLDNVRVVDLPAPWTTDYGIATNRLVNPGVGATTTSLPNALIEFTFVHSGTNHCEIRFRMPNSADINNCWMVQGSATNGGLTLNEVNGGTLTTRASAASLFTAGQTYRVVIVVEGNKYLVYVNNVQRLSYTDSNNLFLTATGVRAQNVAAGGLSELVCWPRTVSLPSGV